MRTIPFSLPLALLLAACGGQDSASNTTSTTGEAVRESAQVAAAKQPAADAPLKSNESIQGMFEADIGKGMQSFRSIATRMADDLAAQMEGSIAGSEGRKAIDDANRRLDAMGAGTKVSADDVRNLASSVAGQTFHDSSVLQIDIINRLQVNLNGKASDGGKLTLDLSFDDRSLALTEAKLSYRPANAGMFDAYASNAVQVNIERFARNEDGSYAMAGTFSAESLVAEKLSKNLQGKTLPGATGHFDFAALPLKSMPKFGVK